MLVYCRTQIYSNIDASTRKGTMNNPSSTFDPNLKLPNESDEVVATNNGSSHCNYMINDESTFT